MRCDSIKEAIAILNDALDLSFFPPRMTSRMKKHSCFSAEDIEHVIELQKKWNTRQIIQSYLSPN